MPHWVVDSSLQGCESLFLTLKCSKSLSLSTSSLLVTPAVNTCRDAPNFPWALFFWLVHLQGPSQLTIMLVFLSLQIVFALPDVSHPTLSASKILFKGFNTVIVTLLWIYTAFHVVQMWFQSDAINNDFQIVTVVINNLGNAECFIYKYIYTHTYKYILARDKS